MEAVAKMNASNVKMDTIGGWEIVRNIGAQDDEHENIIIKNKK